jgi:parvulin-like peptidyl-prolyl isomerase
VKHRQCYDRTTWRSSSVTRTKDEAHRKIANILTDIRNGVRTFEDIAIEESDCPNTHSSGGHLGWIKRGIHPINFEKVAFSLKLEEVSDPIETSRGFHLILRRA